MNRLERERERERERRVIDLLEKDTKRFNERTTTTTSTNKIDFDKCKKKSKIVYFYNLRWAYLFSLVFDGFWIGV